MSKGYQDMSVEDLLALKHKLSKELSAPDDKTNPEVFVSPGKTKVQTGTSDVLDTDKPEGSVYDTVTKPKEGKSMTNVKKEEATELIPMGGKPVGSKPSAAVGPKAEEEHDLPSVAQGAVPAGAGQEAAIKPPSVKPLSEMREEEDEEEDEAKRLEAKAAKLRLKSLVSKLSKEEEEDEEEDEEDEVKKRKKEGGKFAPLAEAYRKKTEEAEEARVKLDEARTMLEEELGSVQSALAGKGDEEEENEEEAGVKTPAPSAETVTPPQYLAEEEEDDEACKTLKAKGRELFTALKAVQDALDAGTAPAVSGNVQPSHPQPEAKIPAQPGKSGSSEVYREEKGVKPDLTLESPSVSSEESGGNPKKITQTIQGSTPEEVSGVYPKSTEVVSGVGYTGETVGKGKKEVKAESISDLRPTYKELGRDKHLPILKFIAPESIPTVDEVKGMAERGELLQALTKEYHATTDVTLPEKDESLLRKGLRLAFS